jgi:hypothetical protein
MFRDKKKYLFFVRRTTVHNGACSLCIYNMFIGVKYSIVELVYIYLGQGT